MTKRIPNRPVGDLPHGWYPFSARPILPELEPRVLEDLAGSWQAKLPELLTPDAMRDPFAVRTWPERILEVQLWRRPMVVLLGGGADPFDGSINAAYLREIFKAMVGAAAHAFVLLTRRVDRAALFLRVSRARGLPPVLPPNITIGVPHGAKPEDVARVELLWRLPVRSRFAVVGTRTAEPDEQGSLFSA